MTCIRAYFPGAKVSYSIRNYDGHGNYVCAQDIWFRHNSKMPFQVSILNLYNNGRVELYNHSRTVPVLTEKKLLNYLRRISMAGWYVE